MTSHHEPKIVIIHRMRNKNLPNTFNVGRPTVLGNPYTHYTKSTLADIQVSTHNEAVSCYEDWLDEQVDNGNQQVIEALKSIMTVINQGETVHLACWCKDEVTPFKTDHKYCHADVIRNFLLDEWDAQQEEEE